MASTSNPPLIAAADKRVAVVTGASRGIGLELVRQLLARTRGSVLAVARGAYDHVIVDTFPLLDGIAIATFDRADQVWQVVAPTVPNVLGAERFNELLLGVGVERERQRIVLNTSVPKHTGQLTPQDVATRLDRDLDGHLNLHETRQLQVTSDMACCGAGSLSA